MNDVTFYFLLTVFSLVVQGFFSMLEMALMSFNRVNLQYYLSQGFKRAKWITTLLDHPSTFFGTTLIGVNTALQFGSEASRRLYISLGINPDFAPITQIIFVLIFAELAPMFAARKHAEQVSMLGVPLLIFFSSLLKPFLFLLDLFCRQLNKILKIKSASGLCLSRDDLQKTLEIRGDDTKDRLNPVFVNIFTLSKKKAIDVMVPLGDFMVFKSDINISEFHAQLKHRPIPFVPIYSTFRNNIIGILFSRDLIRFSGKTSIQSLIKKPWFISETSKLMDILKQFKVNNQSVAIVLNKSGKSVGILTLDKLIDEIFGQRDDWISINNLQDHRRKVFVDRSFPGSTSLNQINSWFSIKIPGKESLTLNELMEEVLGHPPTTGDVARIDGFELSIEDTSLLSGKTILVRSIN